MSNTSNSSIPSAPSVPPPPFGTSYSAPPPAPPQRRRSSALVGVVAAAGIALGVVAALVVFIVAKRVAARSPSAQARSVVRVVLEHESGTGFFARGPDAQAYVVTAYHVVDSGEPILVERTVEGSKGAKWTEAYPDTEVVAFDPDADLAVIRLRGVSADHFAPLPLADAPAADETVMSYGYPASSLAERAGLVSKPGKVLSLVKFPVVDRRTGEVVRNDAVDGLLVSSDIEPGFSGGPTCNDRGEVVGVNVTKDVAHRGQNGAVSVASVSALLARVAPAGHDVPVAPEDVKALLTRIQSEYLLLPVERRWSAPEDELVSAGDMPRVGEMISAVRRLEADTSRDPKTKLSGQALLGLTLARLPGRPLSTYTDPSTRRALGDCELRQQTLARFFGALARPGVAGATARTRSRKRRAAAARRSRCAPSSGT
jgi:S1-C subfamily serine protease